VDEKISIDEFLALPDEAPEERGKVNWDLVLEQILNKPVTVRQIIEIVKKSAPPEKKVYYSEITGWLARIHGKEYKGTRLVVIKKYKDRRAYYLVTTEAELSGAQAKSEEDSVE